MLVAAAICVWSRGTAAAGGLICKGAAEELPAWRPPQVVQDTMARAHC
jgi:hypothetical protein